MNKVKKEEEEEKNNFVFFDFKSWYKVYLFKSRLLSEYIFFFLTLFERKTRKASLPNGTNKNVPVPYEFM